MMFAGFERRSDHRGRRRYAVSLALAGLLYLGGATAVVLLARGATRLVEEPEVDVTFRPSPAAPPPAMSRTKPAPAPRPRPRAARAHPIPAGPGPSLVAPRAISDSLAEADPGADLPAIAEEGAGPELAPRPVALPQRMPPPPPPLRDPDPVTAPTALAGNASPEYPPAARAKSLEGIVILKLTIAETGRVVRVDVLRGNEPFVAAALAAVRSWRYAPALRATTPISYTRILRIPFRIRAG